MADDAGDLLYGATAIARHLNLTPRQVYGLIEKRHLPSFRMGGSVCATKSALARHFDQLATQS